MSAAHLYYLSSSISSLSGNSTKYKAAELRHLSLAFRGLRLALQSGTITTSAADNIISTSLLIFHHAWASDPPKVDTLSTDHLLTLATGVRTIFFTAIALHGWGQPEDRTPDSYTNSVYCLDDEDSWSNLQQHSRLDTNSSIFQEVMRYRPSNTIQGYLCLQRYRSEWIVEGPCSAGIVEYDLNRWASHVWICRQHKGGAGGGEMDGEVFVDFMDAAGRLVPILVLLRLKTCSHPSSTTRLSAARQVEVGKRDSDDDGFSDLVPDLARLLFSWPVRNRTRFTRILKDYSASAQALYATRVLWLYFHLAARMHLLYDQARGMVEDARNTFWWSDWRTSRMLRALWASVACHPKAAAGDEDTPARDCHTCLGWAKELMGKLE
jgi:hypothetical protein